MGHGDHGSPAVSDCNSRGSVGRRIAVGRAGEPNRQGPGHWVVRIVQLAGAYTIFSGLQFAQHPFREVPMGYMGPFVIHPTGELAC